MSTARDEAYWAMIQHGFRADMLGVAMHRPNEPAYSRPGLFMIDDWR